MDVGLYVGLDNHCSEIANPLNLYSRKFTWIYGICDNTGLYALKTSMVMGRRIELERDVIISPYIYKQIIWWFTWNKFALKMYNVFFR